MIKVQVIKPKLIEEHFEGLELQNEIHYYKQDQVYLEVNKVASMAEREEANARLVGDYNMESRYDQEKCDGLEREQ